MYTYQENMIFRTGEKTAKIERTTNNPFSNMSQNKNQDIVSMSSKIDFDIDLTINGIKIGFNRNEIHLNKFNQQDIDYLCQILFDFCHTNRICDIQCDLNIKDSSSLLAFKKIKLFLTSKGLDFIVDKKLNMPSFVLDKKQEDYIQGLIYNLLIYIFESNFTMDLKAKSNQEFLIGFIKMG